LIKKKKKKKKKNKINHDAPVGGVAPGTRVDKQRRRTDAQEKRVPRKSHNRPSFQLAHGGSRKGAKRKKKKKKKKKKKLCFEDVFLMVPIHARPARS
jgi:hypothetical protein